MNTENFSFTNKSLKEIRSHGNHAFPVDFHMDYYSPNDPSELCIPLHWHPEVEIHYQLYETVKIRVELTKYTIHPGEALWINAKQLHNCHPMGTETAVAHTIIFHPSFLYGSESSVLFRKYIQPILENPSLPALHITPKDSEQKQLLDLLHTCSTLQMDPAQTWELQLLSHLASLWGLLFSLSQRPEMQLATNKKISRDRKSLDHVLNYIHTNYANKITLQDLARESSLSTGECGRLCKRILHQTPMNYLMSYRIEQSIPYLLRTDSSITEIALQVGFSGASYYTEIFHRLMGLTPTQYRNLLRSDLTSTT